MAGERILVVDDGQENREFVVDYILKPAGYDFIVAKDGKQGLEMALEFQPDLILLDLQMPRMNGIQVLKGLATRQLDIPVILMTFHGSEDIAIEVYRLGVRDYVKKPYSVDEMLGAIERSLTETRLRNEKEALTERVIQANRELQLRLQELNVLYSIGKSVTSLMGMHDLLPRIVDAATQVTHAEEGALYLLHSDKLICLAQKRHNSQRAEPLEQEVGDKIAARVIETGQPLVLTPEQLGNSPRNPVSVAYAPLVLSDQVLGVLGVRNVSQGTHIFSKHHSAILSALTDYAAIAIENSRNFEGQQKVKELENARIRNTFKRFVPPSIVDQVLKNPEALQLGGVRQEITVLFADIDGYTTFSEQAEPEKVIELLNDYLSLAANVMMMYGGTLDKYMGDGIMAMFNAPEKQENHVQMAAEAAAMLQHAARELIAQHDVPLSYSIGLNVGEAVVGYIGTDTAVNYTAVGDAVNVAKRLQENAPAGSIVASEAVVERLGDIVQSITPLGELTIKGRQSQVNAFELEDILLED